jgi:hypothetical protein
VRFSFAGNNTHRSATFLCGHDILFTDDTEVEDMIPGFARTLDETIRRESSGNCELSVYITISLLIRTTTPKKER